MKELINKYNNEKRIYYNDNFIEKILENKIMKLSQNFSYFKKGCPVYFVEPNLICFYALNDTFFDKDHPSYYELVVTKGIIGQKNYYEISDILDFIHKRNYFICGQIFSNKAATEIGNIYRIKGNMDLL